MLEMIMMVPMMLAEVATEAPESSMQMSPLHTPCEQLASFEQEFSMV